MSSTTPPQNALATHSFYLETRQPIVVRLKQNNTQASSPSAFSCSSYEGDQDESGESGVPSDKWPRENGELSLHQCFSALSGGADWFYPESVANRGHSPFNIQLWVCFIGADTPLALVINTKDSAEPFQRVGLSGSATERKLWKIVRLFLQSYLHISKPRVHLCRESCLVGKESALPS